MNYCGNYSAGTSYGVGDIAIYTDGVPYIVFAAAPTGATPHDTHYWRRVDPPFSDVVVMFHEMLSEVKTAVATIPTNINDEAITLSTDTADYLITVDDSGDTPELTVTAIEEEGAGT